MTKASKSTNKSSSANTPTYRSHDNGGKSKVRNADKQYHANNPHGGNIAEKHEQEEQPVHPGDRGKFKT